MFWLRMFAVAGFVALIGCGGGPESKKTKSPEVAAKEKIKLMLEGIAETGRGGSEVGGAMQELEKLKETDPALADELMRDAESLMSPRMSSSRLKQKAGEMIEKLEGGSGG
ncbi:MAG: hypothetical protein ACQESR_25970 [Planctomycetota bacterium]